MNSLVGYGSSDEEEEVQDERPAKISKLESKKNAASPAKEESRTEPSLPTQNTRQDPPPPATVEDDVPPTVSGPATGPAPGPSIPIPEDGGDQGPPLSPYTYERQRLRELTMPTIPNFDIPDSPPPPARNSEEAAALAATTKKFSRFLDLKKQGVHFNERLQNSASLRNPSLLPKLMDFAGISQEESYKSSLPEGLGVTTQWPEECYIEHLMKQNERREKKRAPGEKMDFVPAKTSARSSATSTPGERPRKSKFHR